MKDHRLLFSSLVLLLGAGLAWAAGQGVEASRDTSERRRFRKVGRSAGLFAFEAFRKQGSGLGIHRIRHFDPQFLQANILGRAERRDRVEQSHRRIGDT